MSNHTKSNMKLLTPAGMDDNLGEKVDKCPPIRIIKCCFVQLGS